MNMPVVGDEPGFLDSRTRRCVFCQVIADSELETHPYETVTILPDAYPVTQGHHLVVTVRHVPDFFEMSGPEVTQAHAALHELRRRLQQADPSIIGFNVGMNCGKAAGQTIMHAHIHLIPRRAGDTPNPQGGVRGVVPEHMAY
jgi:diadenosine tetraphosphate (Ap4A) HIT family hydrolase